MRRTARLTLALAWPCLLATAAACGDDDDDGADIDAGTGEDIDAGVDIDAAPPPDAPPPATVTVLDETGSPVADVPVVFHDGDGDPIQTIATGEDGKASREVPAGGAITVALEETAPSGTEPSITAELFTFLGVQPGDDLVVGLPPPPEPPAFVEGEVQVQVPDAFEGANAYQLKFGCLTPTVDPDSLFVGNLTDASCLGTDGKFDVLAVALTDGVVSAYSFATDIDFVQGGTTPVVNLPPFTAPTETTDVTTSNPPPMADLGVSSAEVILKRDTLQIDNFVDDLGVQMVQPRPTGFFDAVVTDITMVFSSPSEFSLLRRDGPVPADPVEVDLSAELLPRIAGVIVTSQEIERPAVTVVADGDLSDADGGVARLEFVTDTAEVTWFFLFPTSSASFQAPALPEPLAHLRPTPQSIYPPPGVGALESTRFAGYDEFRNGFGFRILFESLPQPVSGETLRMTGLRIGCSAAGGGGAGLGACLVAGIAGLLIRRRRRR